MDPVSLTAAGLTFVEALKAATQISSNALTIARTQAQRSDDHRSISQSLQDSVSLLQRLNVLRESLHKDEDQLRYLHLRHHEIEAHFRNAQALNVCLGKLDQRRTKSRYRFKDLFIQIVCPAKLDEDLRNKFRLFNQSLGGISLLLTEFNASATVQNAHHQRTFHEKTISAISSGTTLVSETKAAVDKISDRMTEDFQGFREELGKLDITIGALTKTSFPLLTQEVFDIPYPRNRWFTGRESILVDIQHQLVPEDISVPPSPVEDTSVKIFVIHGLPGIGKSNLAIEFGYRYRAYFTHVFWISADSDEKFNQGLVNMARLLGLTSDNVVEEKSKTVNVAMSWLKTSNTGKFPITPSYLSTTNQEEGNWLLILDNVDDSKILNPFWSDLRHGSVLITSRDAITDVAAITENSQSLRLTELSPEDGANFVKKRLQKSIKGELDDDSAAKLAQRLACYPLWMDHVISFVGSNPLTLEQFYEQLDSEFGDDELQDLCGGSQWYTDSLAKALEAHIARTSLIDSQAKDILTTIAFFDPDAIPERLILSPDRKIPCLSSSFKRQKMLASLSGPSFIQQNGGDAGQERCISLHRLVGDAALRSDSHLQAAFDRAVYLLRRSFPLHKMSRDHMVEEWAECEIFQPHVLSLYHRYRDLSERGRVAPSFDFIELIYSCSWYLCERGRFDIGEKLISKIYQDYLRLEAERIPGCNLFLADIYTVQLYYHNETTQGVSLVELASKAMSIREHAVVSGEMDEYHPNRANGPMNVGVVLALEDPSKAIELHTKALNIRRGSEKYKSEQVHGLALNLLNIGRCWWVVGELDKAAACFSECLGLLRERESQVGKKFSVTAWAMLALGIVYADQGDLKDALNLMSESLDRHVQTMGKGHLKTLACQYRLGWLCMRMGEFHRAEQLLSICLKEYTKSANQPKAEIARTKFQLARVLRSQGVADERWMAMEKQARELLVQLLGERGTAVSSECIFTEEDFDAQISYFFR